DDRGEKWRNFVQMLTRQLRHAPTLSQQIETSDVPSNQLRKRSHATHRAGRHPTQRLCCNLRPLL
ncbi:hypothetical protein FIBSPDRAFT_873773, partial [Athelia psychrophila]